MGLAGAIRNAVSMLKNDDVSKAIYRIYMGSSHFFRSCIIILLNLPGPRGRDILHNK